MIENPETCSVKLVDFGFAEKINPNELASKAGTPGYIPPEIFKLQPYLAKGDIYAVGVIMYMILVGRSPFRGKKMDNVMAENRRGVINMEKFDIFDFTQESK